MQVSRGWLSATGHTLLILHAFGCEVAKERCRGQAKLMYLENATQRGLLDDTTYLENYREPKMDFPEFIR